MKAIVVCALLLMMLVLTGCPLLTKNCIDEGSFDIPSWMAGTWKTIDVNGSSTTYILKNDIKRGNLRCFDADSSGNIIPDQVRNLIMSEVGDKIFLFAYERGGEGTDAGYYVYDFHILSNISFIISGVKENVIDYNATPAEIKAYLLKNKDNQDIFDPLEVYKYVKQ